MEISIRKHLNTVFVENRNQTKEYVNESVQNMTVFYVFYLRYWIKTQHTFRRIIVKYYTVKIMFWNFEISFFGRRKLTSHKLHTMIFFFFIPLLFLIGSG